MALPYTDSMRITVFGATGHTGRLLVAELLARGHGVVAFAHRSNPLPDHPQLTVRQGDVRSPGDVAGAITGSDAVASALGSWHGRSHDVLTAGMTAIIPAMRQAGVTRIVSLTGIDARADGDSVGILHRISHTLAGLAVPAILHDGERHIALLAESGLDWTVVRSPVMTKGPATAYRLDATHRPAPWSTIPRAAVATAMADSLDNESFVHQAPFITRR